MQFSKARAGNVALNAPFVMTFKVQLGDVAGNYMVVYEFESTLTAHLEASIYEGKVFLGVIDTNVYNIDITRDKLEISSRAADFIADL